MLCIKYYSPEGGGKVGGVNIVKFQELLMDDESCVYWAINQIILLKEAHRPSLMNGKVCVQEAK